MIDFKCSNPADIAAINSTLKSTAVPFSAYAHVPGLFCYNPERGHWDYEVLKVPARFQAHIDHLMPRYDAAPHAVDIPLYHPELLI
jgi:hypothetical protein